jgi:molybdate transport system permease protein
MDLAPLVLSLQIAILATLCASVLGIALGLALTSRRFIGREIIDAIATAPMVMPPTVLGYYLLVALGRHSLMGHAWEAATGSPIVFTRSGAVVAATVGALPLVVKSSRAALESVDTTLVQAARTLGASPTHAWLTVQLPLAARGLYAAVMLAFARSLGDFGVTLMVAGDIPGETQTAALAIYDAIAAQRESAAAGMVAALTATAITALYLVNRLTARDHRRDG